jgi:hypothetical protein
MSNSYQYGKYRVRTIGGTVRFWVVVLFRMKDGIIEAREANNRFSSWKVIEKIPAGAEIL